ncbi:MAG: hypothetical protein CMI20_08505, partial [Opitutae bacterium]|nr:hypothetical protein [Opitutae bacterium]
MLPLSVLAQTIVPPGIGALSTSQPARGTAVLTGQLLSTGGQNPTVKIRWGDEDRGTAVNPSVAWDNEITVSTNQSTGTFSTTITIPNKEKIYYFRSVAENAGGTVVSRSLGVLNPSAPVGVSTLLGRWSFDDDNFSDILSPANFDNLQLWLDASDSSTITHSSNSVTQWNDKSGNGNHATQSTASARPTYSSASQKIVFDGGDILQVTNDP